MGKPVVRGTRITVETILRTLSSGGPIEQVLESYPRLTREAVLGCPTGRERVLQDFFHA
jgi:uncharacterized protein (DUF433 family)